MTTVISVEELMSDGTPPLTPTPELRGSMGSLEDDRRNNTISTSDHNIMSLTEMTISTNTTSVTNEYHETGTSPESTSRNIQNTTEISISGTSVQLDHDVQTTTSASWTENRTSDTDEANITTQLPLVYSTHQTDVTQTAGSYGTTGKSPAPSTAGTSLEILSTKQTPTDATTNTTTPAETSGHISIPVTPVHSTQVTSGSTDNTKEPLLSTTEMMDWKTQENTEALTTTQGTVHDDTTNTTWRAWPSNTEDTWSTNSTMLRNISTAGTETPRWTNCFSVDSSSQHRRFSNLVCFITLWSLAMMASIFLGLTVFLWVRLSVTRKRARLRGRGRRDRTAKEKESLWAEPDSSNEERVEFWYANGTTVEENKKRNRLRRVKTRKNEEEQMDMWIQPKVTMKDITEFWYANGRVRHEEETM
ncbi:mucin-2 isoform X2 [Hemibagrus wyckioides]|nr:mucin-2 isoform X2 [Hemibagrus wyckioides]XP_058265044.1 mucin-2 isoform X2 [Hemibagrus wyckioides]